MPSGKPNAIRCGGSVYVYVLSTSTLIALIGLGALAAARIQMQSCRLLRDYAEARTSAVSAIELGLLYIRQNPNWRQTRPNGTWIQDQTLGSARLTLQGIDPGDNTLNDSEYEPLLLTGIGAKGIARHKAQVTLVPVIQPFDALNTCLHASGPVHILAGKQIAAVGAPISTNGQLDNDGIVDGDVQAQSANHTGTVTGVLTVPAPARSMPGTSVIADYIARATPVPYVATIDKAVLAPGCNPWGPTDPNGLYYIDTNGGNLTIRNSRIHGTLIVRAVGKTLTIDTAVCLQSYRSDFPALLVEGNVVIKHQSCDMMLSEASNATNYNPVGAPCDGASDDDQLDVYPNEIRGLIHIVGTLSLQQSARIVGVVICDGSVTCEAANAIVHDPGLFACPPDGYAFVAGMAIAPKSWKQVVD